VTWLQLCKSWTLYMHMAQ